jgi:AcrR family transcriptional regulator
VSKKDETRRALLLAAIALFSERGYEQTTTAAVAARAGVTEMTLFRHFPTKASLVVSDPYDPLIAESVRARPADESPLHAAMAGVLDAWTAVPPPDTAAVRERLQIVAQTPSLRSALAAGSLATEAAVAGALADRTEPGRARIVAASLVAALNVALLEWSLGDGADLGTALRAAARALEVD